MIYADGDRFVGTWKNNWRSGQGNLFRTDGTVLKVNFRGDEPHGVGYLHLPDGIARKQKWVNGVLQSEG